MSENNHQSGQEKTLEPSPGKLQKARRDGDVAQSKEATAVGVYLFFYLAVILAGGWITLTFVQTFLPLLDEPEPVIALLTAGDNALVETLIIRIAPPLLLLIGAPALGVVLSVITQRAFSFAPKKIAPKLSRISPLAGVKKKFGPEGLVEFAKSTAKLTVICLLFGLLFGAKMEQLPSLSLKPAASLLREMLQEFTVFFGMIVIFSMIIAAVDLPWTHYRHRKKLRMTREEGKKENKENEGDPALKQKRQEKGRKIAENRMMMDVPKADIVLVNPTHYAVALLWDRDSGKAPVCVAKGTDEIAAQIRKTAALANVPIRSDPPTTRAIWATVEIGEEIKRDQYKAVAAAIHFADRMRKLGRTT